MPPAPTQSERSTWLMPIVVGTVLVGIALRFLYLDADPKYYLWAGYVTDEGRWTQQARSWALYGAADLDFLLSRIHLLLGGLYQAVTLVFFKLFGVNLTAARAVSAVAGTGVLLTGVFFLRRRLTALGLLVAAVLLAFHPDLVFLSRAAIPEAAAMWSALVAFTLVIGGPHTSRRALLAGVVTLAAIGFKATIVAVVPVLLITIFVIAEADEATGPRRRAVAFLAPLILPVTVALVFASIRFGDELISTSAQALPLFQFLLGFKTPYEAASLLMEEPVSRSINVLLAGLWLVGGTLMASGVSKEPERPILLGGTVWIGLWLGISLSVEYFPFRYMHHVLPPLALTLGAGVSVLDRRGVSGVINGLNEASNRRRAFAAAWMVVPIAFLATPAMMGMLAGMGLVLDRVVHRLMIVVLLSALGAAAIYRFWRPKVIVGALVVTPLMVLMAYFWGHWFGWIEGSLWQLTDTRSLFLVWTPLFGASLILSAVIMRNLSRGTVRPTTLFLVASVASFCVIGASEPLVDRSYTIRDAGRRLAEILPADSRPHTVRGDGLFLANALHYQNLEVETEFVAPYLVMAFRTYPGFLTEYALVEEIPINVGERYVGQPVGPWVRVYARQIDAGHGRASVVHAPPGLR